jgi:poly-gamma-glutamate synthesis protein (capsule biosynthesis protein)
MLLAIHSLLISAILLLGNADITLLAVGDVMLARGVGKKMKKFGISYPFENVKPLIKEADIAFCNLECPITEKGIPIKKKYVFKANPEAAYSLAQAGFDIVSLANNHILDCGERRLLDTFDNLSKHGIKHCGAGKTKSEIHNPLIIESKDLNIAFLAYSFFVQGSQVASVNAKTMINDIVLAKQESDVIIVSLHWGEEYATYPDSHQIELAHQIIDAGASLVLGHHPHVFQPVELYHGGIIAYSLGNFVFDQKDEATCESTTLLCGLSKQRVSKVILVPIVIEGFRPVRSNRMESYKILDRIGKLSLRLNTTLVIKETEDNFIGEILLTEK